MLNIWAYVDGMPVVSQLNSGILARAYVAWYYVGYTFLAFRTVADVYSRTAHTM